MTRVISAYCRPLNTLIAAAQSGTMVELHPS
jgi:hypothetical protein